MGSGSGREVRRGGIAICLDCGCLEPANDHGDKRHITLGRARKAAKASGLPLAEAVWNIPYTLSFDADPAEAPLAERPVLAFDCDGILAFTSEALVTALNARFETAYSAGDQAFFPGTLLISKLPPDQAGWIAAQMRTPAFVSAYAPDFHALDVMRDAYDAGYVTILVTERSPDLQEATGSWLAAWGGPPVPVHAVGHGNKPAWLAARYGPDRPAILLDDDPAKQVTVAQPGIDVWAPQRPYTPQVDRAHVRRFSSWAGVRYWLRLGPQP